ncbi:toll/interleukin-1 receptor domain-containing protein [Yersinia proxima]|uniref:toll/interleukin-1 receptor domain-containing protein n=1 Tax=Yersinia proxima TaxID=2890316 RepID=UPI001D127261|nr:toll/interleukin-1 receptor domain-containing protein [Yersinia proxima]
MSNKVIFLSHIHEEKELAILLKEAIESEFSGFIDVFVSSDGVSIPAGSNFLKRIEDGLINCIGAIFLLSPYSVNRNWINFELGAVWVRNAISQNNGGVNIPALPFCHSGIVPATLPQPICNLNGITASNSSELEFAFKSLQAAVGGKGKLRTDFDELASNIIIFVNKYTIQDSLKTIFDSVSMTKDFADDLLAEALKHKFVDLSLRDIENGKADFIANVVRTKLSDIISCELKNAKMVLGTNRTFSAIDVVLRIDSSIIKEYLPKIFP